MAAALRTLGRRPDAQRCYRNALKQLVGLSPDLVITELDGATAAEVAIFVSHQLHYTPLHTSATACNAVKEAQRSIGACCYRVSS